MNIDTFDLSIQKFVEKNFDKSQKSIISTLSKILSSMYYELNLDNPNSSIIDIEKKINEDPLAVEKALYNVFKDIRKNKKDSTVRANFCIVKKALENMGCNKDRLKIPSKIKEKDNSDVDEFKKLLPNILRNSKNDSLIEFIKNRYTNAIKHTGCKSNQSKKIMLRYWAKIIESFGKLEDIDVSEFDFTLDKVVDTVKDTIKTEYDIIYLHHLFYQIQRMFVNRYYSFSGLFVNVFSLQLFPGLCSQALSHNGQIP